MYIPLLLVMRQVGVICGPFVIFWTKTWNFNFGGTLIDEMNSASLLVHYDSLHYESSNYDSSNLDIIFMDNCIWIKYLCNML